MPIFPRRTIVLNTHQASIVSPLSGTDNMARAIASAVAEIPSILEVFFWRCGFANIRQSLLSLVERQEAFQRKIGWPPRRSEPTISRILFGFRKSRVTLGDRFLISCPLMIPEVNRPDVD